MESPLSYKKMKGIATMHGLEFQVHLAALLLLRGQSSGLEFQLASNVEGAGTLDDIVFRYQPKEEPGKWTTIYMHLKHKEKSWVTPGKLTNRKGDFALSKFVKSYLDIKQSMSTADRETLFDGSFEKCLFVMFTNAKAKDSLGEGRCEKLTRAEEFLRTDSGSVFSFEENKNILKCLRKCGDDGKAFLSKLRVFCDQPRVDDLKAEIRKELHKVTVKMSQGIDCQKLYDIFLEYVKVWWQSSDDILDNNHDLLHRALEKVRSESSSRSSLANEFELKGDIAMGSFGQVQKVKSKLDGREYALKKIRLPAKNVEENYVELNEVKILASLDHGCITRYMCVRIEPSDDNLYLRLSSENLIGFVENPGDVKLSNENLESCIEFIEERLSLSSRSGVASSVVSYICSEMNYEGSDSESDLSDGPTMYIVMSLYEGNLRQWLDFRNDRNEQIDVVQSLTGAKEIFRGLEYLDSRGIVHHDIKPANVFVDSSLAVVKIGDFGLACVSHGSEAELHGRRGSVPYAPLDEECTAKSDVYSAGIVLLELLSLFGTKMELIETIERLQTDDHRLPLPALSSQQVQLVKRTIIRSHELRPTASEVLLHLDGLLDSARPSQGEDKDETIRLLKKIISDKDRQIKKITRNRNQQIRKIITRRNQGTPNVVAKKDPKTQKVIEKKNQQIKEIVKKKNLEIKKIMMRHSQEMEAMNSKTNQIIKNIKVKKHKQLGKIILENVEMKKALKEKGCMISGMLELLLELHSSTYVWGRLAQKIFN